MNATTYKFASPLATSMRLVATSAGDNVWQIKFHDSKAPYCTHAHVLSDLQDHDAAGTSACPKCASACAHRFAYKVPTKNGTCFFCRLAHASGEKRVKLAEKCASMAVGQGWWDLLLPYDYEAYAPEEKEEEEDVRPVVSLSMLPDDMFFEIVKYLDLSTIEKLSAVEKNAKARLMGSNYGLALLLKKHVEYTFPLVDERYAKKYAPYLTKEGARSFLSGEYKDYIDKLGRKITTRDNYEYLVKHTKGAIIPGYKIHHGLTYDSLIFDTWVAFVYNCRNPHALFQFMITYRKHMITQREHKNEKMRQAGKYLWSTSFDLFGAVSSIYSFSSRLLGVTFDDPALVNTSVRTKYHLGYDSNFFSYQYCENREMLPHTTNDYRSVLNISKGCTIFEYGIKDVVVLSEAMKIIINASPDGDGHILDVASPMSNVVLPYIANRWDDDPLRYALLISLTVSRLYNLRMRKGMEYEHIQNFLKRMRLLNSPDVSEYMDILRRVKYS